MARYQDAIKWMAENDDNEWLLNLDPMSVTASMVADLFDKFDYEVALDLYKELSGLYPATYAGLKRQEVLERYFPK
jgi:hypothetical protein